MQEVKMFTTGFPQEVAARYRPGIEMPGKMGSSASKQQNKMLPTPKKT